MVAKDAEKKISQLQVFEQNFQTVMQQKQAFQSQKLEIDYSLNEIDSAKTDVYKIIGSVMIKTTKENLKTDLNEKKEAVAVRMNAIEKQEKQLKEKIENLQKEIVTEMSGDKK